MGAARRWHRDGRKNIDTTGFGVTVHLNSDVRGLEGSAARIWVELFVEETGGSGTKERYSTETIADGESGTWQED